MPLPETSASVVICTLNRPDDIQRCIASLVKQSVLPKQVIIVDAGELGGVCDSLRETCEKAGIEFIYLKDKPSTTAQRNNGAQYVTSDTVFFLDDDVELEPAYIEELLQIYEGDGEGAIGGASGVPAPDVKASSGFWRLFMKVFFLAEVRRDAGTTLKRSNFPAHATELTAARECDFMPSTAVSYRTSVFNEYLFDRELTGYVMAEDIDLSYRVSRQYRLVMTPAAVYRHGMSKVSRNSPREQEKRRLLFTQYFFRKNLGRSWLNSLVRYWALLGMCIMYGYLGIRRGDMQRFLGLWDGIRAAAANRLLWHSGFEPGPLKH